MIKIFLSLTVCSVLLSSCASQKEHSDKASGKVGLIGSKVDVGINKIKDGSVSEKIDSESYILNEFWVDPNPIITKRKLLNPIFNRRISISSIQSVSLENLIQDISYASGTSFTIASELIDGLRLTGDLGNDVSDPDVVDKKKPKNNVDLDFITNIKPSWVDVKLIDIVKQISSQLSISWSFDEKTENFHFYKYRTETYDIHLPGENINHRTSMTNESLVSGDGSAAVSGSAISTDVTLVTDPWIGLTNRLEIMLSEGGRFSTDRTNFKVTLNDTDDVHAKFKETLDKEELESLTGIVFDVTLMTFTSNQRNLHALNFDSIYESSLLSSSLSTVRPVDTALSNIFSTIDRSTSDHSRNASIFFEALSDYGQASIVDSYQKSTLNNQVTSIMQARNRPYLRSVSIPVAGANFSANGEASLTDLVTGFSLSLRPHLVGSDKVLVSLTINRRSAPSEFENVDAGAGITLERPDIQDDSDFEQFVIRNNETKIISGSLNDQVSTDNSGVIDRGLWYLGGRDENSQAKRKLLLFITARII